MKRAGSAGESQVQHPSSCDREALVPGENPLHGVRKETGGTGKRDTFGTRQSTGEISRWVALVPYLQHHVSFGKEGLAERC